MENLRRSEIKNRIATIRNGRFYSVTFIKKDGTTRVMNTIKGTRKGVKGVGLKFNHVEKDLLTAFDVQLAKKDKDNPEKAWRFINLKTVVSIRMNKETYVVIDDVDNIETI